MSKTLYVVAAITAKPGQAKPVGTAIDKIIAPTRAEQDCISYIALADNGNDHRFVILEQWKSKDALNTHMLTDHFKALVDSIGSIADIEISELSLRA